MRVTFRDQMDAYFRKGFNALVFIGAYIFMRPSRHVLSRALLVKPDHILLMRQRYGLNYSLPGGHVDRGESIQDAVERECLEECGIHLKAEKVLGIVEKNDKKYGFLKKQTLTFVWKMSPLTMHDAIHGREFLEKPEWIPLSDLQNIDLHPVILKKWIPEWITQDQIVSNQILFHPHSFP